MTSDFFFAAPVRVCGWVRGALHHALAPGISLLAHLRIHLFIKHTRAHDEIKEWRNDHGNL